MEIGVAPFQSMHLYTCLSYELTVFKKTQELNEPRTF